MDVRQLIAVIQPPLGSWLWFLVLAGMIAGGIGYRFLSAVYRNWCMSRRFKRGEAAEKKAVRFLQRQGYRILAAQLEETITVYVDGVPQKSKVRADYFVRKGRKKYIVEVKSGQQGTVRLPNVRRQLLEYKLVYRPDGVLLLDMEHRTLQEIRFAYTDIRHRDYGGYGLASLLAGVLVYSLLKVF